MDSLDDVTRLSWGFVQRYVPISRGIVEGVEGIPMFETFGQDLRRVLGTPKRHVWTVIDVSSSFDGDVPKDEDGDDCWLVVAGYHLVNRLGYVITENPWEDDNIEVAY
jgi:hypothetical protein